MLSYLKKLKYFFRLTIVSRVQHIWQTRNLAACLLWPLSLFFGSIIRVRRKAFQYGYLKSWLSPVPLIIIGNLSVGGTGKTPIVIALARALQLAGYAPGILTRGYGGHLDQPQHVRPDETATVVGDEPLLLAQTLDPLNIPVWAYSSRVQCAQALLKQHPHINVLISDDGLQHYALARACQRDVEIVVLDTRLLGNRWLLPAGPLREPLSRRRDITLWTGAQQKNIGPQDFFIPFALQTHSWQLCNPDRRQSLSAFSSAPVNSILASAGIGYPEKFFAALRQKNIQFMSIALPDHFDFSYNPFHDIAAKYILITEKDAVKCRHFDDPRIWVIGVDALLPSNFTQYILQRLETYHG